MDVNHPMMNCKIMLYYRRHVYIFQHPPRFIFRKGAFHMYVSAYRGTARNVLLNMCRSAAAVVLICASFSTAQAQEPSQPSSIGGRFMLQDHNGRIVTDKDYQGRFMLITFGYTYCPDVCPTNLVNMGEALDILAGQAEQVVPIFVTVDPARDDVAQLRDYVTSIDERVVGLTGPQSMIDSISQRYKIETAIHHPEGWEADEYMVDHTASIFLMAPDGSFLVRFAHGMVPADMAKRMQDFLE